MTSLNRWRAKFVLGLSICAIAVMAAGQAGAQTRPYILRVCADCHGYDGIGRGSDIPNLAGQSRYYMRTQFDNFLSGRRRHSDMSYYADRYSDQAIDDAIEYYSKLPAR